MMEKIIRLVCLLLIFPFSTSSVFAQKSFFKSGEISGASEAGSYFEQRQASQKLFSDKRFSESVAIYEKLASLNASDGNNWLNLAESL